MKPLGNLNLLKIEEDILEWWEKQKIYEKIKAQEPADEEKTFRFIDGPPYTTGDVHLGTAWNKIMKDLVIKYKRMQGFRVTDTPGYDTHGLPIEVVTEKKLGIKNKQEIKTFGLDKFISECRAYAESKIPSMNEQFKRLGCTFWDWDNPYVTLKNTYIQGIWWTLKRAWENGYLYKFYKPQNCCPRCATALAKHEYEYHDITDTAIFVKFQSVDDPKTFFIIWTTTPWTLISNTNIMANPDVEYVKMRVKDEYWIMAIAATSDLLQNKLGLVVNAEEGFSYGERYTGRDLEGKRYIHPFADLIPKQLELEKEQPLVHTIILSHEYVQETGGSGLVHTAPGHGPEDFEVGVSYNIPIYSPVAMDGTYTNDAGEYFKGKYVHDANHEIIEMLRKRGTLVHEDSISHEYAHCWRCHTKLVYRATEQWFFKTSALRDEMLKENDEIFWIPEYAGATNFKSWLTSLQDWCISRQRYWGIPLSIWTCENPECDNMHVIGSMEELREIAGTCPEDIHKPWIDEVTWKCDKCGMKMTRIPDVMDVWLDSGSVMWASHKFVDGHEHYDSWVPADFILEGKDQIRGWFNSLLCSAMVSTKKRNYNVCYMHGWVTSHGTKMSKSLGNALDPQDVINGNIEILTEKQKEYLRELAADERTSKFDKTKQKSSKNKKHWKPKYIKDDRRWSMIKGIETFRFYSVMGTPPGKDLNFDYKEYTDTFKVLNTIWNTFKFAQEKMKLNDFHPKTHLIKKDELSAADKWILARTNSLIRTITDYFEKFELPSIPATLQNFILNDLSRWYITIIRDQVEPSNKDPSKYTTLAVLWHVLYRVLLLLAPVNPMLSEEIYQKIFRSELSDQLKLSIHLEQWPKPSLEYDNHEIEEEMATARRIIDEVRSLKSEHKIKLRWPTKGLIIVPKNDNPKPSFPQLIQEMSNVKQIKIRKTHPKNPDYLSTEWGEYAIYLDLEESEEIQQERILRDLLRTIQFLRKNAKLQTGESIELHLSTKHPFLLKTIKDNAEAIKIKVTANPMDFSPVSNPNLDNWTRHGFNVCLNENCYSVVRDKNVQAIHKGESYKCSYCGKLVTLEKLGEIQIEFKKN
ncbi:MAG: isoleucine--tRNA ligase [Candidatus Lokiarchaeota archaeon]|nr:isoleucine--tRNA ligase [Candidatus Harpocratesius repetitus]